MVKKTLMTLALGIVFLLGIVLVIQNESVAAIVTIEINPSVQLDLDEEDFVIKVEALNEDASHLLIEDLIDVPVEVAVEKIVNRAFEAGYIDSDNIDENYVLLSTIDLKEDGQFEKIQDRLQSIIDESEILQEVNVAMIEASEAQLEEAIEEKKLLGLLAANSAGPSVNAFFNQSENKEQFMKKGSIIEMTPQKRTEQFMRSLEKAQKSGEDIEPYKKALQEGSDIINNFKSNINQGKSEKNNNKNGTKGKGK